MVGWFPGKSSKLNRIGDFERVNSRPTDKTGVFFRKSLRDYVVMWRGREICAYETLEAFIDAHEAGLQALEKNQAELLESYYRTLR